MKSNQFIVAPRDRYSSIVEYYDRVSAYWVLQYWLASNLEEEEEEEEDEENEKEVTWI